MITFASSIAAVLMCVAGGPYVSEHADRPNVVFILVDDMGYGDLACYGAANVKTPNIDALARQGMRLTDFYVAQAVCSASRAAFLTGRYPQKLGIRGALGPAATNGVETRQTLPILLKQQGYACAVYGKWHLGHTAQFLPTARGFDDYYGLPYSNDMGPLHPTAKFPPLPLIEGTETIALNPDQSLLTKTYTERAVRFIDKNADKPFFLYVPQTMMHVPLFASAEAAGHSGAGLLGDVIWELDWSVGQIMAALDRNGVATNTIVIFSSDNGPWISYGNHAGSTGGLREGKMTTFEGGVRVPFIVRWPGHIPAGIVSSEPIMSIDILPTLLDCVGAPAAEAIDGVDVRAVLEARPGAKRDPSVLYFYWNDDLQAVREGRWKLHLPHAYESLKQPGGDRQPGVMVTAQIPLSLFDLQTDRAESNNVADAHPDVVAHLKSLADLKVQSDRTP